MLAGNSAEIKNSSNCLAVKSSPVKQSILQYAICCEVHPHKKTERIDETILLRFSNLTFWWITGNLPPVAQKMRQPISNC